MEVLLSSPRGFCAGVVRSIEVVDICLRKFGAPIYVKHQIVHNPHVVADLERKGAITVDTIEEIPRGLHGSILRPWICSRGLHEGRGARSSGY